MLGAVNLFRMEEITTQQVIDKYFKNDGRTNLYFHGSDRLNSLEGRTYLRIEKSGQIELYFGSDNGETCILCTRDGSKLESLIQAIMF